MFDQVGETAERLATNVSRRSFLGSFGKGALAVAGVLAGLFAHPDQALAGPHRCWRGTSGGCTTPGTAQGCLWDCGGTQACTPCNHGSCSPPKNGCRFLSDFCCKNDVP